VSNARFRLLVTLLGVVVAVGSFLLGLALLDDDSPDPAPRRTTTEDGDGTGDPDGGDGAPADGADGEGAQGSVRTDPLPSPSWLLVIASEGDEARALALAGDVAAAGHDAGVLRSDDYPSLNPGFWVAYAGPYDDAAAGRAAEAAVEADGWPGAYLRCAGTVDACGGTEQADEDEG